MKISKDLSDALEAVNKEVESWPAWKRSIDSLELKKKLTEASDVGESSNDSAADEPKRPLSARAAKA